MYTYYVRVGMYLCLPLHEDKPQRFTFFLPLFPPSPLCDPPCSHVSSPLTCSPAFLPSSSHLAVSVLSVLSYATPVT